MGGCVDIKGRAVFSLQWVGEGNKYLVVPPELRIGVEARRGTAVIIGVLRVLEIGLLASGFVEPESGPGLFVFPTPAPIAAVSRHLRNEMKSFVRMRGKILGR